jgi:hypothetical protein
MSDVDDLKHRIREAFADVLYPGDGQLVAHANYGDAYTWTGEAFRGLDDWRTLDPTFLDEPLNGWGNALSFFTPSAFRFYLPAYLLADLDKPLEQGSPYVALCFGLSVADQAKPTSRKTRQETRHRGGQTRFMLRSQHFADFTPWQANAVVAYLRYVLQTRGMAESTREMITEALQLYWLKHAEEPLEQRVGINKRNSKEEESTEKRKAYHSGLAE